MNKYAASIIALLATVPCGSALADWTVYQTTCADYNCNPLFRTDAVATYTSLSAANAAAQADATTSPCGTIFPCAFTGDATTRDGCTSLAQIRVGNKNGWHFWCVAGPLMPGPTVTQRQKLLRW
jgi:hypothetical protein